MQEVYSIAKKLSILYAKHTILFTALNIFEAIKVVVEY